MTVVLAAIFGAVIGASAVALYHRRPAKRINPPPERAFDAWPFYRR